MCPVSVLGSIMDVITSGEGEDLEWWVDNDNLKTVVQKAKRMAKGFSGAKVSDSDKNVIVSSVFAFATGVNTLAQMLKAKKFETLQRDAVPLLQNILKTRYQNDTAPNLFPSFLFPKEKILRIWGFILDIAPSIGCEMGFWVDMQLAYLEIRQESSLPRTSRNIVTGQGKDSNLVQLLAVDNFLLDIGLLCNDMYKTMTILSSEEHEEHVGHIVTVLAEPWDRYKE